MKKLTFTRRITFLPLTTLATLVALSPLAHAGDQPQTDPSPPSFVSNILINNLASSKPVNRKLLGNNTQWTNHGDGLLDPATNMVQDWVQPRFENMVTSLRYPGGSNADLYHWENGTGEYRGQSERFHDPGTFETIDFGTAEFLEVCRQLDADPVITVNIPTGDPTQAAAWVNETNNIRLKNQDDELLPTVKYWEIGNEPYLVGDGQTDLEMSPENFALQAIDTILAMKAVDSTIKTGVPLRSEYIGGIRATAGSIDCYNDRVIDTFVQSANGASVDFVSVHNAYLPFFFGSISSTDQDRLYRFMMAASQIVVDDLNATQDLFPNFTMPLAMTEYNTFYTLQQGATDQYVSSLTSALYLSDLLVHLTERDDILMANYWSLLDNWVFGTTDKDGENKRAAYHVLDKFSDFLTGDHLDAQTFSPRFDSEPLSHTFPGSIACVEDDRPPNCPCPGPQDDTSSIEDIPWITASVTTTDLDGAGTIKIWAINKNPDEQAKFTVQLTGLEEYVVASHETFTSQHEFQLNEGEEYGWVPVAYEPNNLDSLQVTLPTKSLNVIELVKKEDGLLEDGASCEVGEECASGFCYGEWIGTTGPRTCRSECIENLTSPWVAQCSVDADCCDPNAQCDGTWCYAY